MTFGRSPEGTPSTGDTQFQGQSRADRQQTGSTQYNRYGDPQYMENAQYPYQQASYRQTPSGAPAIDGQAAYSYEQARRVSVAKAYGEMTIGLVITAFVAVLTQATGALSAFLSATGMIGWIGLAIVQVVLAISLGARIMKMRTSTARAMFYIYAALMGFTLSSIFMVYDLGSIGLSLGLCVGFFFALTMLALTTKRDMLKAGPILMVALLVLIVGEVILMFVAPSNTTIMAISAIGLIIFAGLTAYDAQKTRALFAQADGPEMIRRMSILCALNLYLDFINMFLYLLRLFGSRN